MNRLQIRSHKIYFFLAVIFGLAAQKIYCTPIWEKVVTEDRKVIDLQFQGIDWDRGALIWEKGIAWTKTRGKYWEFHDMPEVYSGFTIFKTNDHRIAAFDRLINQEAKRNYYIFQDFRSQRKIFPGNFIAVVNSEVPDFVKFSNVRFSNSDPNALFLSTDRDLFRCAFKSDPFYVPNPGKLMTWEKLKWQQGPVIAMAMDNEDHLWVFSNPRADSTAPFSL